jgi:hypothetical protein
MLVMKRKKIPVRNRSKRMVLEDVSFSVVMAEVDND